MAPERNILPRALKTPQSHRRLVPLTLEERRQKIA